MSFFEDFNEFLVQHSGTTGQAIAKLLADKPEEFGPVFFKPYTSTGNFFLRAAYVATAPVFLAICTAEMLIGSLILALDAAFKLITFNGAKAKEQAVNCLVLGLFTVGGALFTLGSPFINAVDLIGSLFAKPTNQQQEQEEDTSELSNHPA